MKYSGSLLCYVLFSPLLVFGVSSFAQQVDSPRPAARLEPIGAILDAFRSHRLVALGEPHGNEQAHLFRLSLVRDPRFAAAVNDIVVECGNARYQEVMDRFVRGDDIPAESLRQVWQNTTAANFVWDRPIYEEFFWAVRAVNASRRDSAQLRVLLGDPPIDWDQVHSADDLSNWQRERDVSAVQIIRREVLAKRHRALVVYGDGHLWRRNAGENIVTLLESEDATDVFTITTPIAADVATAQSDIGSWPRPSIALLRGTVIGAAEFAPLFRLTGDRFRELQMEDQADAVLYLGPPSAMTVSRLSPTLCTDSAYQAMRLGRMGFDPGPPGAPTPSDQLKRNCANVAPR